MRFKAILAEAARKRYPLSVMLFVISVLVIPFPYLFIRFGLELTSGWWTAFGIVLGIVLAGLMAGLASLVEDIHDISMHTVGFDLEVAEAEEAEGMDDPEEPAGEPEAEAPAGEDGQ